MFGGIGVFKDGLMFGLVDDDVLYMKADETTAARYEAEGQSRWAYEGKGKQVALPYWRLPDRLYDEPDEFREWALVAFGVAEQRKKAQKPGAKAAKRAARPATRLAGKKPKSEPLPKPKKRTAPKRC